MYRMLSIEQMKAKINASDMNVEEKVNYLMAYEKNYYAWLDELKQKLADYQPPFEDLDKRRSISPSFNYSEENFKNEVWKEFPLNPEYAVSNLGRIKYEGKIQKQKDEKIGYVTLADENLRKDYIYNFVAYTFLGKKEGEGMHVHHITNDGYYNTEDNLVLLTKDEHSYVHGFEVGDRYATKNRSKF